MPYVNNNHIRIHYAVEGSGPPLVLQHGSLGRGEDWENFGYAEILKRDNQLILVDARGHGASDKPHEQAAYDMALRVSDITAVLDELQIGQSDYFGYSMGGWIGFGLAKYVPERWRSIIIGGAHPYFENLQPFREIMPQEPAEFALMMEKVFGRYLTPQIRAALIANDLKAVSAFMHHRASLAEVLPLMTMPCLLFVGEDDPRLPQVQQCCRALANATLVSFPGCDHVAGFARSDLVLPHVTAFLASTRQ
jgi:pimeloyl-ACP methyl ester carboxylesterase